MSGTQRAAVRSKSSTFSSSPPTEPVRKRERFLGAEEFLRLSKVLDEILEDGSETRSSVVTSVASPWRGSRPN